MNILKYNYLALVVYYVLKKTCNRLLMQMVKSNIYCILIVSTHLIGGSICETS